VVGLGNHTNSERFQRAQPFDRYVFDFNRDAVEVRSESNHGLCVLQITLHKTMGEVAARRICAGVHDFHSGIEIHSGLDHHAAELAPAQYADAQ